MQGAGIASPGEVGSPFTLKLMRGINTPRGLLSLQDLSLTEQFNFECSLLPGMLLSFELDCRNTEDLCNILSNKKGTALLLSCSFPFTVGDNMQEHSSYIQRGITFPCPYFQFISSSVSVDELNCFVSLYCTIN